MWADVQKGCGMGLFQLFQFAKSELEQTFCPLRWGFMNMFHLFQLFSNLKRGKGAGTPLSGRQLRRFAPPLPSRGTHEACETVLDGFHAFLRTQYAMRQAEGAARGVTSLH